MSLFDDIPLSRHYADELGPDFSVPIDPTGLPEPALVDCNPNVAELLGLPATICEQDDFLPWISGNLTHPHLRPVATVYAGHQFGQFVPQLGDGRALLMGDIRHQQTAHELQLKGSGKTPYSRFADGRCILRATIREYLCSTAMQGLGIPTTWALAITSSSEPVFRDELADQASTLVRVARSHVRFGTFEYFHFHRKYDHIRSLCDFLVRHHLPEQQDSENRYQALLQNAIQGTAKLIAQWQAVGFIHGVMNTDNMSILGETLDYGPFGFMEAYDPGYVCNHSDDKGRYAYNQQPLIGLWNCNALAHAFSKLLPVEALREALQQYEPLFIESLLELQRKKLGLTTAQPADQVLIDDFLSLMAADRVDYTSAFRHLSHFSVQDSQSAIRDLFINRKACDDWLSRYRSRLNEESVTEEARKRAMLATNPKYILRNYMAEIATQKARKENDFSDIQQIRQLLTDPFSERPDMEDYAGLPPDWASDLFIGCAS